MCGIVGYVGKQPALDIILDGLQRLEYRGYDSAGFVILRDGVLAGEKVSGKLANLLDTLTRDEFNGNTGIGHTRWATHGLPSQINAHPHYDCSNRIAIVHNGIIENHEELKDKLTARGHHFRSQTDTEIISHLVEEAYTGNIADAVCQTAKQLVGSFAIAAISCDHPGHIVGIRRASPLVVAGSPESGFFLASDVPAILPYTRNVVYLEEDMCVTLTETQIEISDLDGQSVNISPVSIDWDVEAAEKQGHPHFMYKEILEQGTSLTSSLAGRISDSCREVSFSDIQIGSDMLRRISRIVIISCGTAWHAGLVSRYALQEFARIATDVEMSSEFRYGDPIINDDTLYIAISQSGETADTLAAVKRVKESNGKVLAVCNVVGSSLVRMSDGVLYTHAGPEIGVASTKAYTAQLAVMLLFAIHLAQLRKTINQERAHNLLEQLSLIPSIVEQFLSDTTPVENCAKTYSEIRDFLFIGRHYNFPTAYEGALKLKEISYLHAEGYGAGEMKHGPIALVDEGFLTVAIAVQGRVYDKMISNILEVKARGGRVVAVATEGDTQIGKHVDDVIFIPETIEAFSPIVTVIPLQLFAYHTGIGHGCNVDQPRNLAKSVTVE